MGPPCDQKAPTEPGSPSARLATGRGGSRFNQREGNECVGGMMVGLALSRKLCDLREVPELLSRATTPRGHG